MRAIIVELGMSEVSLCIRLSRNSEARIDEFYSNQPPCDLEIVHTIEVEEITLDFFIKLNFVF